MGRLRSLAGGALRVAAVLVHYHTPELVAPAWEALEKDAAASGLELEGILVDNGSSPEARAELAALPLELIEPGSNLGYAGGVNLGVASSRAEVVVAMNPDVWVRPGCLGALVEALESGAAVAGPRFFWDEARHFLLPPTETRGRWRELRALLAQRAGWGVRVARRAWRRRAHRFWEAREPYRCTELSGALLAFQRETWERVGPFDESFQLYFEETDWLLRLVAAGLEPRYVPAAEAVHLFEQSSVREPSAQGWFDESARRFRRRHYGLPFALFFEFLARHLPTGERRADRHLPGCDEIESSPKLRRRVAWLEVSRSPLGFPAAGRPIGGEEKITRRLPAEIWDRLAPGTYRLRLVDARGTDLAVETLEKPA